MIATLTTIWQEPKKGRARSLDAYLELKGTTGYLVVNETWLCNDVSPTKP